MNPSAPVYIVSKGRWESRLTAKALLQRGIPFRIVVEPQEWPDYASHLDPRLILTLPFSNLGQGSIPARNWIWEHALSEGHRWHWILDDNIPYFFRLHQNVKWYTTDGAGFAAIEQWAARYENVGLAGMQYAKFARRKQTAWPAIVMNTRIYSCILVRNDLPFRWRGRYNEDTDLSLRVLKAGLCTGLFNVFLADKQATMRAKGGNTDELYQGEGRLEMARSLQRQHPDVVRLTHKWGRWQHHVDYRRFRGNKLILKPGVVLPEGTNEFGMTLAVEGQPWDGNLASLKGRY